MEDVPPTHDDEDYESSDSEPPLNADAAEDVQIQNDVQLVGEQNSTAGLSDTMVLLSQFVHIGTGSNKKCKCRSCGMEWTECNVTRITKHVLTGNARGHKLSCHMKTYMEKRALGEPGSAYDEGVPIKNDFEPMRAFVQLRAKYKQHDAQIPVPVLNLLKKHDQIHGASQKTVDDYYKNRNELNSIRATMNNAVAEYIYTAGLTLDSVEGSALSTLLAKIRPDLLNKSEADEMAKQGHLRERVNWLKSRRWMSEKGLEELYGDTHSAVMKMMSDDKNITLSLDGWSKRNVSGVVNVCLSSKLLNHEVVVDSIALDGRSENAQFLVDVVKKNVQTFKSHEGNVIAVTGDNASVVTAALKVVHNDLNNIITHGCDCHRLSLVAEDLYQVFKPVIDEINAMMKKIRLRQQLRQKLDAIRARRSSAKDKIRSLTYMSFTRWGTIHNVCSRIAENHITFVELLHAEDWPETERMINSTVERERPDTDANTPSANVRIVRFIKNTPAYPIRDAATQLGALFKPIALAVQHLESRSAGLHEMLPIYDSILQDTHSWLIRQQDKDWYKNSDLLGTKARHSLADLKDAVLGVFEARAQAMDKTPIVTDLHHLASALNERATGCILSLRGPKTKIANDEAAASAAVRIIPADDNTWGSEPLLNISAALTQFRGIAHVSAQQSRDVENAKKNFLGLRRDCPEDEVRAAAKKATALGRETEWVIAVQTLMRESKWTTKYWQNEESWISEIARLECVEHKLLRPLALRVNAVVPHSASVERANSAMKRIDTDVRASLKHDRVRKLTFILHNLKRKKRGRDYGARGILRRNIQVVERAVGYESEDDNDAETDVDDSILSELDEEDADELLRSPLDIAIEAEASAPRVEEPRASQPSTIAPGILDENVPPAPPSTLQTTNHGPRKRKSNFDRVLERANRSTRR